MAAAWRMYFRFELSVLSSRNGPSCVCVCVCVSAACRTRRRGPVVSSRASEIVQPLPPASEYDRCVCTV